MIKTLSKFLWIQFWIGWNVLTHGTPNSLFFLPYKHETYLGDQLYYQERPLLESVLPDICYQFFFKFVRNPVLSLTWEPNGFEKNISMLATLKSAPKRSKCANVSSFEVSDEQKTLNPCYTCQCAVLPTLHYLLKVLEISYFFGEKNPQDLAY